MCAHAHTSFRAMTLSEALPETQLSTQAAWFINSLTVPLSWAPREINSLAISINQTVLLQHPAMGPNNLHVHFYSVLHMEWEEISTYPSGSYLPSSSGSNALVLSVLKGKYVRMRLLPGQNHMQSQSSCSWQMECSQPFGWDNNFERKWKHPASFGNRNHPQLCPSFLGTKICWQKRKSPW